MEKRRNGKAKGLGICLSVLLLMAMLMGNASAAVTVTDSVSVSGQTATFSINITGATNITDVYVYTGLTMDNITTEQLNWTSQTGTTFENTTGTATELTNSTTYYYKICYKDNATWDNTTIGSFAIGSGGLTLLALTDAQASEVAIILTYGLIFGLWFIIALFAFAMSKAKRFRKTKPMVNLKNGTWLGVALLVALLLTFATWYLCNIYLTTDWLEGVQNWIAGFF